MNQVLAARAAHIALVEARSIILNSRTNKLPRWVYTAKPYLRAIAYNNYGLEDPVMCVLYALNNMVYWRGPVARVVKAILNESIK